MTSLAAVVHFQDLSAREAGGPDLNIIGAAVYRTIGNGEPFAGPRSIAKLVLAHSQQHVTATKVR
jgi:hypothetical protein